MACIRRARMEDARDIGSVHAESVRAFCAGHYAPSDIEAWVAPRPERHYDRAIREKDFYVAEDGEGVIGFAVLNPPAGEVEAVYVRPRAARRGVGLSLLRTLEEQAKARGLTGLRLCASLNAVPFYERAGFARGELTAHRLQTGVEIACVRMTKVLTENREG
ncbi:MAG: GNAT family N-acetyltransferase [Acidobacteria bacterium]|nr:GNAT family N-acetyltransferase [Acidobacteriota bacterium]